MAGERQKVGFLDQERQPAKARALICMQRSLRARMFRASDGNMRPQKAKNFKMVISTNAVCVYKSEKRHNSPIKSKADQSA